MAHDPNVEREARALLNATPEECAADARRRQPLDAIMFKLHTLARAVAEGRQGARARYEGFISGTPHDDFEGGLPEDRFISLRDWCWWSNGTGAEPPKDTLDFRCMIHARAQFAQQAWNDAMLNPATFASLAPRAFCEAQRAGIDVELCFSLESPVVHSPRCDADHPAKGAA